MSAHQFKKFPANLHFLQPVPRSTSSSQPVDIESLIENILSHPIFEDKIKEITEGFAVTMMLNKLSSPIETIDNPFDSIYIAQLYPDTLSEVDVQSIEQHSLDIQDLSDTISFDDEWDD